MYLLFLFVGFVYFSIDLKVILFIDCWLEARKF